MRAAVFAPMPGSPSRSLAEAVFRLTIAVGAYGGWRAGAFDWAKTQTARAEQARDNDEREHGTEHRTLLVK
jgi:hypothetical protein